MRGTMKGILIDDDKNLHWQDTETPEVGEGQVRIKIHATAINRADLMQRRGFYPPPPGASTIMGLECAGEIDQVGQGVDRWRKGDGVCALLPGGGYAEYAVAHEGSVLPVPSGFSYAEAAALPEVFATVWLNLFMQAELTEGEKVILHAGGSGIGTAGIQLCKSFGNPCYVTVGSDEKLQRCLSLGAAAGTNRHQQPFLDKAREFAGDEGIGVILDPVGGSYLKDNINLLALEGRLVLIGLMGGGVTEIDLSLLLGKRLKVIGSTLRTRTDQAKARIMAELEENVWPKLASREITSIIDTRMPITETSAGHDLIASDNTFGKVVMIVVGSL